MTKKIFQSTLLTVLLVLVASLALIMGVLYSYFSEQIHVSLRTEADLVAQGMETSGEAYFSGLNPENRITWIAADGTVLYDSDAEAAELENHADREEIMEALADGEGEVTRYSSTMSERTVYYARLLDDGTVLRLAITHDTVFAMLLGLVPSLLLIVLMAVVLALLLARRLSKRIVRPLAELDLQHPEDAETYAELTPLLSRLHNQNSLIQTQMEELGRKQREFEAITENMQEGLVVIDERTNVLSWNTSARQLLGGKGTMGESVLLLNRSEHFRQAVELALSGKHNIQTLALGERTYELLANPVQESGHVSGAVLLLMDVTERQEREQLRREFTANVSHELKTPLTVISGTAEMLKNGFVKPEDVTHFAGNIYDEAQSLIGLVNDIIKLSQLDEGGEVEPMEPVDLYALAETVLERLREAAERAGVTMTLSGAAATVPGSEPLLEELLYNLCDNAIKYNRPDGKVTVKVEEREDGVYLSVADTGIGIAPEHQSRVFERFYRVDKSHSRKIGGTGLGLSIVKHAASYHGAEVSLDSTPGEGTCVTVYFPKSKK